MKKIILFSGLILGLFACKDELPKKLSGPNIDLPPSNSGLIAHYYFNMNAKDETSFKRNGTLNGPVDFVNSRDSKQVNAASFNGENNYITLPGIDLISDSSTVSIWFLIKFFPFAKDTASFISLHSNQSVYKLGFYNKDYDSGNMFVEQKTGGKTFRTFTDSLPTIDRWYHFAATTTPEETILYVDGRIFSKTKTNQANWFFPNTILAYVGSNSKKSGFLNGYLDDLRIYDKTLNSQEIIDLYTE